MYDVCSNLTVSYVEMTMNVWILNLIVKGSLVFEVELLDFSLEYRSYFFCSLFDMPASYSML